MNRFLSARALALIAGAAIAVAACSGSASPSPSVAPSVAASPSAAASASPEASGSAEASGSGTAYTLAVATGSIGMYLTGEDGKTLYVFKNDTAGSGTSACTSGTCATNWPAFKLDDGETATAGAGVTGDISSITWTDGTKQVTYKGQPLYYFHGDTKAGDTNGQGVAGLWSAAAP